MQPLFYPPPCVCVKGVHCGVTLCWMWGSSVGSTLAWGCCQPQFCNLKVLRKWCLKRKNVTFWILVFFLHIFFVNIDVTYSFILNLLNVTKPFLYASIFYESTWCFLFQRFAYLWCLLFKVSIIFVFFCFIPWDFKKLI